MRCPQRVLDRGYTITQDARGRVLRSADAAREAGRLTTVFPDGTVTSRVSDAPSAPQKPKRKTVKPEPDQNSLF